MQDQSHVRSARMTIPWLAAPVASLGWAALRDDGVLETPPVLALALSPASAVLMITALRSGHRVDLPPLAPTRRRTSRDAMPDVDRDGAPRSNEPHDHATASHPREGRTGSDPEGRSPHAHSGRESQCR